MTGDGYYRFRVGSLECVVLRDFTSPGRVARLFSEVPEGERKAAFIAHGLDPELQEAGGACTCIAVKTGARWILIDAGFGKAAEAEGFGELFTNMAAAGLKPADFSAVIISHLHTDHYVGLVDENGQRVYTNAEIYIGEDEWRHSARMAEEFPAQAEGLRDVLLPLRQYITFTPKEGEIVPGVRVMYAPGHTAHTLVIAVESGEGCLLCAGDVYLHPLFVAYPQWKSAGEYDPAQAQETRAGLCRIAARRNCLVQACHFPFPGLGYIHPDGETWRWVAL